MGISKTSRSFILTSLIASSIFYTCFSLGEPNNNNGFRVQLTRKPIRSSSRATMLPTIASSPSGVSSAVTREEGYYTMSLRLGSPPFTVYGIVDTANELTWIQCNCSKTCFNQNAPVFDFKKNPSLYQPVSPNSPACAQLGVQPDKSKVDCPYTWDSTDGSFSNGFLLQTNITLGDLPHSGVISNAVIGCGKNNSLTMGDGSGPESGIFGLSNAQYSLLSQMGSLVGKTLSYCLAGHRSEKDTSNMAFGSAADVSGSGTVVTALMAGSKKSFYYLHLESITIGSKTLPFSSSDAAKGNMYIDIVSVMTLLPQGLYASVEREVKNAVKGTQLEAEQTQGMLCYYTNVTNNLDTVRMTMNFKNTKVALKDSNIFVWTEENVACLGMGPVVDGEEAIYGNLAQAGFLVGLDLNRNTVAFKPTTNCNT